LQRLHCLLEVLLVQIILVSLLIQLSYFGNHRVQLRTRRLGQGLFLIKVLIVNAAARFD
jgi:hypothetical protein